MSLHSVDRERIEREIDRRFRWRNYHAATDAVFPLTMRRIYGDGEQHAKFSIGTGFGVFSYSSGVWFLVSNYHCFSGKRVDGSLIGSFVPNFVDVEFRYSIPANQEGYVRISSGSIRYPLLGDNGSELFFHLAGEGRAEFQGDIALLPIAIPDQFPLVPKSHIYTDHRAFPHPYMHLDSSIGVGDECFVIGYPRGMRGDGRVPIWKRGTLASEPNNTYQGKVSFLVDCATREGMSGSPVIFRQRSFEPIRSIPDRVEEKINEKLIGVYAGRIGEDELGVQLGIVWSIELLELLISTLPVQLKGLVPVPVC